MRPGVRPRRGRNLARRAAARYWLRVLIPVRRLPLRVLALLAATFVSGAVAAEPDEGGAEEGPPPIARGVEPPAQRRFTLQPMVRFGVRVESVVYLSRPMVEQRGIM